MEQRTVELFDLPYQWVFPLVFITMTIVIGYCFVKYVILANDKDEEDEEAEKGETEVVAQSEESAPLEQRESSDEKSSN